MKVVIGAIALGIVWGGLAVAGEGQPYAGMDNRSVKTLSDQQLSDLREGRGMGMALAAELNG